MQKYPCDISVVIAALNEEEGIGPTLEELQNQPYGLIYVAEIPPSSISATKLRERAAKREDISDMIPESELKYITAHAIY